MSNGHTGTIDRLFKYVPRSKDMDIICPSELIGKIPLRPQRTSFKLGLYLTTCDYLYSREMEDILSIGYTPNRLYSIHINSLSQSGYNLIDNEDNPLLTPLNAGNLTRIWPAFGQAGGASEAIATCDSQYLDLTSESEIELADIFVSPSNENRCIKFQPPRIMKNAPRYQIFTTDTVSPTNLNNLKQGFNFLKIIYSENQEGGFLRKLDAESSFAKVTDSGVIIKPSINGINITLSAGFKKMPNYCYGYIIGSNWSDQTKCNGKLYRLLNVTEPSIFHWPCKDSNNLFTGLREIIKEPVRHTEDLLNKKKYKSTREVEIPIL